MGKEKVIFHIDVNSAYLSWTAVKRLEEGETTDIREIPCIVGGDKKAVMELCWQNPFLQRNMAL